MLIAFLKLNYTVPLLGKGLPHGFTHLSLHCFLVCKCKYADAILILFILYTQNCMANRFCGPAMLGRMEKFAIWYCVKMLIFTNTNQLLNN